MKRRNFIIGATIVGVGLPTSYYIKKHYWKSGEAVFTPDTLSNFCGEGTLREIGEEYRQRVPAENDKQKLTDLILADKTGKQFSSSDKVNINEFIEKKNQEEFLAFNSITLKGWIISITEARQCALLSLT